MIEQNKKALVAVAVARLDEESGANVVVHCQQTVGVVELHQGGQVATEPLPAGLQWHNAAAAGLEVGMVGSAGTAFRPVVKYHQLGIGCQQALYFAIALQDGLRLVATGRNGEVGRQNGVGIHQQLVFWVEGLGDLFRRTVFSAQKAGALGNGCLVDAGTC